MCKDIWPEKAAATPNTPKTLLNEIPHRAARVNHSPAHMLESAVMKEVSEVILLHPKVLWAIRQNTGEADYETFASGHSRRVRFWNWVKRPGPDRYLLADFWMVLKDGRFGLMECKRRDFRMTPSDDRAQRQQKLIDVVKANGGVGGIVTCAEDALEILNAA